MSWMAIVVLAAGAYGLKLLGVTVLGEGETAARLRPITALVPAALFTGLVVALSFDPGGAVTPSRLAGVAVAGLAAWRKAPFIVVVLAAMATTALVRAV